jgi:hypothetical protein
MTIMVAGLEQFVAAEALRSKSTPNPVQTRLGTLEVDNHLALAVATL